MISGECLSCALSSKETLVLYKALSDLYALSSNDGIYYGENKYCVINLSNLSNNDLSNFVQLIKTCSNSPGAAERLASLTPKLIENAHYHYFLNKKIEGVKQFKAMLDEQCTEQEWQNFFKEHHWILGSVHDIQYLSDLSEQPILSSANFQRKGEKRGDFLKCTSGSARFTAIVEIKLPSKLLLEKQPYRQDIYSPSKDLNGGLSQLRTYLRKWQIEGSRTEKNRDILENSNIYTVQPRGILILGHLDQIKKERDKWEAFEIFRYQQKDIHIVTFDEVLGRAEALLGCDKKLLDEDNNI